MKLRDIDYIWSVNEHALGPLRRWWLRALKRLIITVECIMKNNIMSYASALTYSTMLAAVPMLAIIFGIAFRTCAGEHMKSYIKTLTKSGRVVDASDAPRMIKK